MQETDRKIFWSLNEKLVAGLTIYGEARGETDEGKVAVCSVILTRVDHRRWDGKTIKEVCFMPAQFSCYLSNDPNYPRLLAIAGDWRAHFITNPDLRHCCDIAEDVIMGAIPRNVHATQYYNPDIVAEPAWVKKMNFVAKIGSHLFYIDKELS